MQFYLNEDNGKTDKANLCVKRVQKMYEKFCDYLDQFDQMNVFEK